MPKFYKACPILYTIKEAVEHELDKLESDGILEKVNHSAWASPIVVVPKSNNKIRLCVDYKVSGEVGDQYPYLTQRISSQL